jgi:4-oxalocrotonate tautomerase
VRPERKSNRSVLEKKPEYTHVVIQEIEDQNWGFAGMLTDDFRKLEHE